MKNLQVYEYRAANLPLDGLAKMIATHGDRMESSEVFREEFLGRIFPLIDRKLTGYVKRFGEVRLQTARTILETNPDYIAKFLSEFYAETKDTEDSIARIVRQFLSSKTKVCEQYEAVKKVVEHPEEFGVLETMCSPLLKWFVKEKEVYGMSREDQRNVGLTTVWNCAQHYRAQEMARFTTMVRKALRNKFIDLTRARDTDKRRVAKDSINVGSFERDECYFLGEVEQALYGEWCRAERVQLAENAKGKYDPFLHLALRR